MNRMPRTIFSFSILSVLYLIFGLTLPPNTPTIHAYNLSVPEYRVLVLLIDIPLIAIWFASFYGYTKLEEYTDVIRASKEGTAFRSISRGLMYMAWGMPIISIISTLLGGIVHSYPHDAHGVFVFVHYLPLVVALLAFENISRGARQLTNIVKVRPTANATRVLFVVLTLLGVLFTYFTIRTAQRVPNPYHVPVWLILLTIITPYLYAWLMGLFASYEIILYSQKIRGLLYKRALQSMAVGVVISVVSSVFFQYLQSDTTRLRRISFSWIFVVVYLLLIMYATGYLLIARGAKQLKRIEEV